MSATPTASERRRGAWAPRWLVVLHRYLGVAVGLLMLMWFATGAVMLFVPYPSLPESERLAALPQSERHAALKALPPPNETRDDTPKHEDAPHA